jgi:hypothetical protein
VIDRIELEGLLGRELSQYKRSFSAVRQAWLHQAFLGFR